MEEFARLLDVHTYVEIGILNGDTIARIAPHVERAVGVDIRKPKRTGFEFFHGTSSHFISQWNSQIDMLLIDGDHSKESVQSDFYGLIPYVTPNTGLVFLHDTYPVKPELLKPQFCGNAWEVAKEIRLRKDIEIVTIPGPWAGLSIIRKLQNFKHGWMDK